MAPPHRTKLIEVALPLDAINAASAREKSIRHGHPSTLHLWWARRPLAAARAVLFAQLVDDPSAWPELFPTEAEQQRERERLFRIIEQLVQWENTTNEEVVQQAREEIRASWRRTCAAVLQEIEDRKEEIEERNEERGERNEERGMRNEEREERERERLLALFDPDRLPAFHDPFAGGGAIPLEAQRLGLEAHASDLNPVAVTINKAMIEIPPKFRNRPPVNPQDRQRLDLDSWHGAQGLAADVRYYGQWMRDEAQQRIGHLYPQIEITPEMAAERPDLKPLIGTRLTVIAWLWARTVKSPNPAFAHVDVPLVTTFILSSKPGNEAYVEPVIHEERGERSEERAERSEERAERSEERAERSEKRAESDTHAHSSLLFPHYSFRVRVGKPPEQAKHGTKLARGANFRCLLSGMPISGDYIKAEGRAGRMGARMLAIVADSPRGRVYLPPTAEHEAIARSAQPTWKPETALPNDSRNFWTVQYGLTTYGDLFTPRQLVALTTFADLVGEAIERVKRDYLDSLGARASRPRSEVHCTRLPHWEAGEVPQHIVFRLDDSLPTRLLAQWEEELRHLPETRRNAERQQRIEQALDAGHGSCLLRDPALAQIVEDALLHFDGLRYRLHEWAVMPNHVHVLVTPLHGYSLSSIVHSWKSYTAKAINRVRGSSGPVWQEDYFDRMVRDEAHFAHVAAYVRENPQRAGLPEDLWVGSIREATARQRRAGRPPADDLPLHQGGTGATAYAQAVGVYLAFGVSRASDYWNSNATWEPSGGFVAHAFTRQAIPMVWDFAESNPFSTSGGNWLATCIDWIKRVVESFTPINHGQALLADARFQSLSCFKIISTDPPYYDNIGYADLSDFFYVWLRRTLRPIFPDLYATLSTPKAEELVATPYRHGSKQAAERFFMEGMTRALRNLALQAHPAFPVTIFYAFKQQEVKEEKREEREEKRGERSEKRGEREPHDRNAHSSLLSTHFSHSSTGWETFLDAVIQAGFAVTGTWPLRTERGARSNSIDTNALASSIVLVCRPRPSSLHHPSHPPAGAEGSHLPPLGGGREGGIATRRAFVAALKAELPAALAALQRANIAPVDLAQAAIGPGMAVYTRYARVVDAQGCPVSVREALALINQTLDEVLSEQEGDFDADTRWALAWFEQHGFAEGDFGVAETLSKAKNTSIEGLAGAGILDAKRGKVRLLKPAELSADWDPAGDARITHWAVVHHLIRVLETGGEMQAAELAAKLGSRADVARELAYRLYVICERKKRPDEAFSYNALVQSWGEIARLAQSMRRPTPAQHAMDL